MAQCGKHNPIMYPVGRVGPFVLTMAAAVSFSAWWSGNSVAAQDADAPKLARGALVRVELPLPDQSAGPTIRKITEAVKNLRDAATVAGGDRPVLLLELLPGPPSKFGEGCSFYAALELADCLVGREVSGVKTVAYVPQTLKGHGVLVAMACQEIIIAPAVEIGDAGFDEAERPSLDPVKRAGYEKIARARQTIPEAIALGMVDRAMQVWKVETEKGTQFATTEELESLQKLQTFLSEPDEIIPVGTMGNFTGSEARQLGFVKFLAASRDDVADELHLPPTALIEDSLGDDPNPVLLEVSGPITPRLVRQLSTMLADEKKRGSGWIGVRINSRGGEISACLELADVFARQAENEVRTVAFVTVEAAGGAALVALACDQLVMQPKALLGGEGGDGDEALTPETLAVVTDNIKTLAKKADRPWSIFAAMIDPHLEVFKYRHKLTGRERFFSPAEVNEQDVPNDWIKLDETLTLGGKPLVAERAKELGIAWETTEDLDGLAVLYGFDKPPRIVEPNWALELVEALSAPGFAMLLLMIGFFGLYIELQAPGVGIGGFVAGVAFLLFFWSNFLTGTAEWLEVLLFVGGICAILLEIFVLPGFGVFGLGGGLMVITSLILASQTFVLPHSAEDLSALRRSLSIVTGAGVGVIAAAMLARRYLPHAPMFSRLLLNPPEDGERATIGERETTANFAHLVGEVGTAATNLRPSGKGNFDGQLIDVLADSDPIDNGERIEVVDVRGNRVLVRSVRKS